MPGQECQLSEPRFHGKIRNQLSLHTELRSVKSEILNDNYSQASSYYSEASSKKWSDEDDDQSRRYCRRKCYCRMIGLYVLAAAVTFGVVFLWREGYILGGRKTDQSMAAVQSGAFGTQLYNENGDMICNGLASNCNRRLNEIMYATVHNAMSSKEDNFLAPNNLYPLEDALMAGYRALAIDSCDCTRVGIQLCHTACLAGFRRPASTFAAIVEFMLQNKHEVVIIELQILADSLGPLFDILFKDVDGLSAMMYHHPNKTEPWPTLKELIDKDQRLIFFQHDGPDCDAGECPDGVHNTFTYMFETPFEQKSAAELMDVNATCAVHRGWSNADFVVSNHFANDEAGLPDYKTAVEVNSAANVQRRLDACLQKLHRKVINLLMVDFWSVGEVLDMVHLYNSQLPPLTAEPSAVPSAAPTVSPKPSVAAAANAPMTSSAPTAKFAASAVTSTPTNSPSKAATQASACCSTIPQGWIENYNSIEGFYCNSNGVNCCYNCSNEATTTNAVYGPPNASPTVGSVSSYLQPTAYPTVSATMWSPTASVNTAIPTIFYPSATTTDLAAYPTPTST